MLRSIRFRLWLSYALLVLLVVVVAGSVAFYYLARNPPVVRSELERLKVVGVLVAERGSGAEAGNLKRLLRQGGEPVPALQAMLERAAAALDTRLALYSASGELLADSAAVEQADLPPLKRLLAARTAFTRVFRDSSNQLWLYAIRPLEGGYFLLSASPRPRAGLDLILQDEFLRPFIRITLLAFGLALILAIWLSHWIAAPLGRLAQAAAGFSQGQVEPLPLQGPSEVRTVSQAFNQMTARLQAGQQQQRELIANVSHELKTPLTSIHGYSQAILDGTAADEPIPDGARNAAQVIHAEAGRMNRMVLQLLDLARLDAGLAQMASQPVDLQSLLAGLVDRFMSQVQAKNQHLQADLPPLPVIHGDAERLEQVFANLLDNAIKFTPPGGEILLSARQEGGNILVSVADSGPGLPPGEEQRIFERFYQPDRARPGGGERGFGLGLAIARQIVLAHGGEITARNRAQGGAELLCVFGALDGSIPNHLPTGS